MGAQDKFMKFFELDYVTEEQGVVLLAKFCIGLCDFILWHMWPHLSLFFLVFHPLASIFAFSLLDNEG